MERKRAEMERNTERKRQREANDKGLKSVFLTSPKDGRQTKHEKSVRARVYIKSQLG